MITRFKAEAGLIAICFMAIAPLLGVSLGLALAVNGMAGNFQ